MLFPNNNTRSAIIIIAFNDARLIQTQVSLIRKFCTDSNTDIIIFDNSSIINLSKEIENSLLPGEDLIYHRFNGLHFNPSESHAYACNKAYLEYSKKYGSILFLDHDCFPVKEFSVKALIYEYIVSGIPQLKAKKYFWAGYVAFDVNSMFGFLPNFSVSREYGLDSGGMLFEVIERFGDKRCRFVDEVKVLNADFENNSYPEYAMIDNGTFMHFINASGWNDVVGNKERIESLYKILSDKTQ